MYLVMLHLLFSNQVLSSYYVTFQTSGDTWLKTFNYAPVGTVRGPYVLP